MNKKYRILLVDDHRVLLDGLRTMLAQEDDFEVVGMAEDGRIAVTMTGELKPDVIVMDIAMPNLNGVDATRAVLHEHESAKVIGLSMHSDARRVHGMLEAGADGYVLKDSASDELITAIRQVMRGKRYLSPAVTGSVIDRSIGRTSEQPPAADPLGDREREVLQLIAEGLTSSEIAAKLHISTSTVDTHRRNIMKKLDVHGVAELTRYAIREGITDLMHD